MTMSVSLKKATNKTNIKHNNRKMSDKEKKRNDHIDYSRSDKNKYLVQGNLKELYKREFGEPLKNYNEKQKRSDRKIDDYYKHIESSKKTSLQQEMIIQVGDQGDFSNSDDFDKANEILEEWYQDFEERNPNLKIYNAVIHNDEASPHLHLNFVPVASDYKRGLEKQVSFDRAIIQQDKELDKTRPFDDWREKEVGFLSEKLKDRGIERKLVGTNQFKDVTEFKEKKDELRALETQINDYKALLPSEEHELPFLKKEKITSVTQKVFGKAEVTESETENYVLTPEQYQKASEQVKSAMAIKSDYERLKDTDLVRENELNEVALDASISNSARFIRENNSLTKENEELKKENYSLKVHIRDLKLDIKVIYHHTREFFKEGTDNLKSFQIAFNSFVEKVKDKTSNVQDKNNLSERPNEFVKEHNGVEKKNKSKDRGMEL